MNEIDTYSVIQVTSLELFENYYEEIFYLIDSHKSILMDISTGNSSHTLIQNLSEALPHLWLGINDENKVIALCNFTDEIIHRHVYIHGLTLADYRKHPVIQKTTLKAFDYAFNKLKTLKVKAEFEARNIPAKGFCWRYGFKREGYFKNDNILNDCYEDVVIYTLTKADYLNLKHNP